MKRDFAHRHKGRQTRGSGLPGWVWMLMGIALGVAGAAVYYITRPTIPERIAETGSDPSKPNGKKKITIPPKEPSRFAFYELLPNYEVVIPREKVQPDSKSGAAASTEPGQYLIQVGSFRDRNEAEQQKAGLALLGIESRVEKVTIDNDQTWFRVRIGPEKNPDRVQTILSRLEENSIASLVMRVPY
ncbi:MAG: SPOR domain-containing protein [Nevskiales bacterium]|nr:SPOR domain-containing protein [Nevskiales bacterium]